MALSYFQCILKFTGSLAHGTGSTGAVDKVITAKGFKEQLAKSRLASAASAPNVVSSTALKMKQIPSSNPCTNSLKQYRPLQPTRPSPFQFATDTRIKQDVNPTGTTALKETTTSQSCEPINFQKMLRTYQMPAGKTTNSTTRPQPFKASSKNTESTERRARNKSAEPSPRLNTASKFYRQFNTSNASSSSASCQGRTKHASGESSYLSMAEQVIKFQTGTPDRFRSRPKRRSTSTPSYGLKSNRGRSPSPLRCTQPHTPNLVTRGRARKPSVLSTEEKEALELEEAKQNQFRARMVGEGVPKPKHQATIERRDVTQPQPFNLTTGSGRPKARVEEGKQEFHALPVNQKIFDGPVGIPARNPLPVIVPESPAFALKERLKGKQFGSLTFNNYPNLIHRAFLTRLF